MKKANQLSLLLFSTLLLILLSSCECYEGHGRMTTESRDLDHFKGVDLSIPASVIIKKGTEYSFEISAEENLHKIIKTRVKGRTLHISSTEHCLRSSGIDVVITMPELRDLRIGGSGDIYLEDHFECDLLELKINGSGDIEGAVTAELVECGINGSGDIDIAGTTEELKVNIKGSGDVDAIKLKSEDVFVRVYGSGDCRVYATSYLEVKISGSGNVRYKGKPDVDMSSNGSGDIIRVK